MRQAESSLNWQEKKSEEKGLETCPSQANQQG